VERSTRERRRGADTPKAGGAGRTFFEGLEVDKARPVLVHEGAEGQSIGPTGGKVANVHPRIPRRRSLAPVCVLCAAKIR
jgi:hypothetical protein